MRTTQQISAEIDSFIDAVCKRFLAKTHLNEITTESEKRKLKKLTREYLEADRIERPQEYT